MSVFITERADLRAELIDVFKTEFAPLFSSLQPKEPEELMTQKDVAKLLDVSNVTVWKYTKDGTIKGYRIAGQVRYKRSEILQSLTEIKGDIEGVKAKA